MAMLLRTLIIFSLLTLALVLPEAHAGGKALQRGRGPKRPVWRPKRHKPKFKPGKWMSGHATFYGNPDGTGTIEGACGYESTMQQNYGLHTTALSVALFNEGQKCGSCYELKCVNDKGGWCMPGRPSAFVTATNLCPAGGWCSPPSAHFDLSQPAFVKIAKHEAGVVPIVYRRVSCQKLGGIRFTITGNPYFNMVQVWNVGGAGDVVSVLVKGSKKLKWTKMKRNWGQKWQTDAMLVGESLTFRVKASDHRTSTSWHITPKNWQFGQTFEGKNFK